ncbi:cytadherence high molecular weight protein 1 isoform X1 [Poecilia latipinna]|uniref:ATP synthase peripheral stalk subunit F6, mitochondrial n=1 Tax=Poecilia latipinna TaxID=48699 RepID=A0A3B3UFR3_9TELE|nr:PREDICTED: cytadherence high molecular weight protein 1-like isoform X1 [Poecilia latipinna]XP_014870509.1 PREDICTED: cytadherence high molecular weight protein 1-like isoform X1 [Poecilia latipinna]XP_014870511.1 PREDICTED: cytadherence high molecular weight protein 1-like isoform X1 [Poecilia latipinna]
MSASLLRIGHLRCVNKCLQTEGWKMLSRAPAALPFSTKSSGSKNSSKKTSKDKSKPKTYFDIEKLVQHKPCNFPKKEVSPAASAVTEAALEAIASAATKHTPPVASAGTIASTYDGTTQAVTASFVKEVPSNIATDESTVEVVPEAFPGEDALMLEASKVAAEPAVDVPQVPMHPASVESAPDPLVDVALVDGALNLVHEAGPNKAEPPPAEGSLKSVVEAAPVVEVAPEEVPLEPLVEAAPVVEAAPEEVPLEPLVEAAPVVEVAPEEASLEPAVEAAPEEASLEPAVEAAPEEASLEPAVEAAPEEASQEPVVEAAPPEPSPKLAMEASDGVPETLTVDLQAPLEPVAEAAPSEPDPAESMPEPEEEAVLEPVAEITDATDVVPGSEDLVDPAWVLSKAAEEELQMDSPAEAVGPSQAHMDPVQRLFLDSIREYSANSQAAGGLVDADPLYQKALEEETAKLQRLYGGGDLTSFPNFKFTEPQWDEGSQK